ncbi:MAG: hypothetical protein AAB383_00690 [Patescibacteria group bacterium]
MPDTLDLPSTEIREVQRAAKQAARKNETNQSKTPPASFKLPLLMASQVEGSLLPANEEWPSTIRTIYRVLQDWGMGVSLVRRKGQQPRMMIVVPDKYLLESELKLPAEAASIFSRQKIGKDSKQVLENLSYFYWLFRRDANQERRRQRNGNEKRRQNRRGIARAEKQEQYWVNQEGSDEGFLDAI